MLLIFLLSIFIAGCAGGPQASFSERFQDTDIFTSADKVSPTEKKCIMLIQPYTLVSGSVAYSLPAGRYIAKMKNKTGYFYYAPSKITSPNWFLSFPEQGIYLDNQLTKGNLFGADPQGYADRPIRNAVLPAEIFQYISKCPEED